MHELHAGEHHEAHRSVHAKIDRSTEAEHGRSLSPLLTNHDWKTIVASRHTGTGDASADHTKLTITDHAKDKSVLADSGRSSQERLSAANSLLENDSRGSVSLTDAKGVQHELSIQRTEVGGNNVIRVSESGKIILEGEVAASSSSSQLKVGTLPADNAATPAVGAPLEQSPNLAQQASASIPSSSEHNAERVSSSVPASSPEHNADRVSSSSHGHNFRVPRHRPRGISYSGDIPDHSGYYHPTDRGTSYNPPGVDHSAWQGVKHTDGSVEINFRGCQVDTDGSGAFRHTEDRTRQSQTSLKLSNGHSLDADRDNYFVLPPSLARAYHVRLGDLGWLVQKESGKAVPVVFGDSGPEGKLGEASVAALKSLGYKDVNGEKGVSGDQFKIVFLPGSGDGTGDIASNSQAMADKLTNLGAAPESKVPRTQPA